MKNEQNQKMNGSELDSNALLGQELEPYFDKGKWRIPYLMDGAGGYGGGIGELSHETLEGVLELYKERFA